VFATSTFRRLVDAGVLPVVAVMHSTSRSHSAPVRANGSGEVGSDPREPALRPTGAIALSGLTLASAPGATFGVRERALRLDRRSDESS
jgi:hypothetical protein